MTGRLAGKTALVTGGSRGLGRAICAAFAEEGARVAFTYARNEEAAREVEAACRALGAEAVGYRADVTDEAAMTRVAADVEARTGGVDVLVNNAGITQNLPFALMEEDDFDRVMNVNVKGVFLSCRAVLRGMIRRKAGVILNIGSLVGSRMMDAPAHYCASKGAVRSLTEAMAKAMARHNIRVVCLAPGLLEAGIGVNLPEHRAADYLHHCALGRLGTFDEVARCAAFLVSDAASFMTGATLLMDGGV